MTFSNTNPNKDFAFEPKIDDGTFGYLTTAVLHNDEKEIKKILGYNDNHPVEFQLNLLAALDKAFEKALTKSSHEQGKAVFQAVQHLINAELKDGYVHNWHKVLTNMHDKLQELSSHTKDGKPSLRKAAAEALYTESLGGYISKSEMYNNKMRKVLALGGKFATGSAPSPNKTNKGSVAR